MSWIRQKCLKSTFLLKIAPVGLVNVVRKEKEINDIGQEEMTAIMQRRYDNSTRKAKKPAGELLELIEFYKFVA